MTESLGIFSQHLSKGTHRIRVKAVKDRKVVTEGMEAGLMAAIEGSQFASVGTIGSLGGGPRFRHLRPGLVTQQHLSSDHPGRALQSWRDSELIVGMKRQRM